MPEFLKEQQNKSNKVSMEYPARLVINGKTVMDEFPDWHAVLQQDRYQLANTLSDSPRHVQMDIEQHQPPQPPPMIPQSTTGENSVTNITGERGPGMSVPSSDRAGPPSAQRPYAQVVSVSTSTGQTNLDPGMNVHVQSGQPAPSVSTW